MTSRNAISETIRKSEKVVSRVVRGFFSDPIHLHKQFCYLTSGVDNLVEKVTENWSTQVMYMRQYIEKKDDKSGRFHDKLTALEDKAHLEYNGARDFVAVGIVRLLANMINKNRRGIFLYDTEEIITTRPFIKVSELLDR